MRRAVAAAGTLLVSTALLAGCGSNDEASEKRTLTVFAAASLTESFGALEKRFEDEHPDVDVTLNLGGSSRLVQQLGEGARADVFASADEKNMTKATDDDLAEGQPAVFATNRLTIAVPPGNPKGIQGFGDLAGDGVTVVVCAPQVPCGSATEQVEQSAGVQLTPASEEQDVKAVLTKVRAGEADAGLVYVTDAASAAGEVERVDFPEADGAINRYPITVVKGSEQTELAQEFVQFVLGEAGRAELDKAGFGAP